MPEDFVSAATYDATLREWCAYPIGRWVVLVGIIEGDGKGRFPDGRLIRTSALRTRHAVRTGQIVETFNSRYLLIGPSVPFRKLLAAQEGSHSR